VFDAETVDGAVLHCLGPVGRGDGPTIVLVNSLGCDMRIWDGVVARLAEEARVLRYDKRGHGLSTLGAGGASIERHAADLAALIERRGGGPALVVGLSIGGIIAMALALTRPDLAAGLALCDTAPRIGTPDRYAERLRRIVAGGMGAIVEEQMTRWFSPGFRARRPEVVALMGAMLARQPVDGYAASVEALRDTDLGWALGAIRVPVLCLTGAADASTPPATLRALADSLPDARYVEIDGAGHLPCVEAPEATAAALVEFRRGLVAAGVCP
jgi:3-oxoadipate enol-lactonase